jgi:hypothetical protein
VSGAVVRAALAATSLALEATEALALASLTVADSLTGALRVKVGKSGLVGGSGPGELVGAEPKGWSGRGAGKWGVSAGIFSITSQHNLRRLVPLGAILKIN